MPAFAFLAPASQWDREAVLIVLLLFSFYAYVGAAHLRDTTSLDATFVAALLGVVLIGPLAGALVFAAPELTRIANDRRLTSMLANLASFGWACLAAAWTLQALGYGSPTELGSLDSYAAVAIAGLALILVNYFYMTIITGPVKNGIGLWVLTRRELIPTMPVDAPMIVAAVVTAFLYSEIGLAGLVPLAGVVFLPRLLVPIVLRDVPIWDLSIGEATARYARGTGQRARPQLIPAPGPARCRHARRGEGVSHPPRRLRRGDADRALLARALGGPRRARPRGGRGHPDREPRARGRARVGRPDRAGRTGPHA